MILPLHHPEIEFRTASFSAKGLGFQPLS